MENLVPKLVLFPNNSNIGNGQLVLKEVLTWTGGQPFLTQKLCKLVLAFSCGMPEGSEGECVEELVRSAIAQLTHFARNRELGISR